MASHKAIFKEITAQLEPIFAESKQAVYVYLDDEHKACNKRFATLLGYSSPATWAAVSESFPVAFVAPKSQRTLVMTFRDAMNNLTGTTVPVTWKKKDGKTVATKVTLVPFAHKGHLCALHFVE